MGKGMLRLVTVAAVVMGLLIVGGTATLIGLVLVRATAPGGVAAAPPVATGLVEPAGTRIAAASGGADALVLLLQGGGPDRVVVVDARSGKVVGRVGLAP